MIKKLMVTMVISLVAACASTQKPTSQVASKSMFGEDCAKTCDQKHEADCYSMCEKMYGTPAVKR